MVAETSRELLDYPSKSSIFETLLLGHNDSASKSQKKTNLPSRNEKGGAFTTEVPKSQVLGKVKDFFGVMAEANQKLVLDAQGASRSNYDIEVLNNEEQEYIEMDLLLGITDLQTPEAVAAAEATIGGFQPSVASTSTSGCSGTEDESDEVNDSDTDHATTEDHLEKPDVKNWSLHGNKQGDKSNKRPKIVVLN